jgi:hypothetical protein
MLRARRLASIAVVATLGLGTLAGCRPAPTVAAYVGSTEFSDARITRIVDQFVAGLSAQQQAGADRGDLKNQVMHFLVLSTVVGDYAEAKDIDVPPADPAGIAQQQQLAADIELTRVLAEYSAVLGALSGAATSISPTEADQREAYEHTTVDNRPVPQPFEEVRQVFNEEALGNSLGIRELLNEALTDADVSVNPRYDGTYRLPLQIQNARSWLAVELEGPGVVRDEPAPRPTQSASGQG